MRSGTEGKYWISRLAEKVDKNLKNSIITIVPDIRYTNELEWIQSQGGITLHLERPHIKPANAEETQNDPLAKAACNFAVEWKTLPDDSHLRLHTLEILNATKILPQLTG